MQCSALMMCPGMWFVGFGNLVFFRRVDDVNGDISWDTELQKEKEKRYSRSSKDMLNIYNIMTMYMFNMFLEGKSITCLLHIGTLS